MPTMEPSISRKLLPVDLRPRSYDLRLEPDFADQSFAGRVVVCCDVVHATQLVRLHSKSLEIRSASISFYTKCWNVLPSLKYSAEDDTVEMRTPTELPARTTVRITLSYTGRFKDGLEGFYISEYETEDGIEQQLAVTFMEPTCARQVFPCFDEPHLKAEFIVSAIIDSTFLCTSNMPVDRTETISETKRLVVFHRSLPMSTYLVALVAGPLSRVESTKGRIPISILCPKGSEARASFALKLASDALEFFETIFDDLFPLPKLDLVAVPDFSSGAMENWGLITFRVNSLLVDPDDAPVDVKQQIARTILHEISHSWFGNLVTMQYWDGLWLKEGAATMLAWYASDKIFPEWRVWDIYTANLLQSALELDSLSSSHPVELVVDDPRKAKQIFDDISYKKGCCILKMLLDQVGEENFFNGLKLYIRRHKFGSTESADLWRAFEDWDATVAERMHVWTRTSGFPVVTVTEERADDNPDSDVISLRLSQKRFTVGEVQGDGDDQLYPLRISVRSETGVDMYDLNGREISIPAQGRTFLKINADNGGFYRTSYPKPHLQKLIEAATQGKLTVRDCIGLSADLSALTAAGISQTSDLLDLCSGFKSITESSLWLMIEQNLTKIRAIWKFEDSTLTDALGQMASDIIGSKARELGWDNVESDDDTQTAFKATLFCAAGLAGDEMVVKAARALFAARLAGDDTTIPPHLRYEVFKIVAAHGNREDAEALLKIWRSSPNEDEKYLALECLGGVSEPEVVRFVLGLVFTKDVKDQDIYLLLWLMGSSPGGATELWEWAKENWSELEQALPASMQALVLGLVLDGLGTQQHMEDVKEYFSSRDVAAYDQTLNQKLEAMEVRIRWARRDGENVRAWLEGYGYL